MQKEKILFIVNPISGAKSKALIPDLIKKNIDSGKYSFDIENTQRPRHAEEISKEGMNSGYKKIVAIGGDGTINEIARTLINTDTHLGIIPSGSGNGLARHLRIPLNPTKAIEAINRSKIEKIDYGTVNEKAFFCTAGVGFDAHVGRLFAESKTRGLNAYIKTTLSEFRKYSPEVYDITVGNETVSKEAFLITFANSAQYGNNAFISPNADIKDGLLDICILRPFPKYKILQLGRRLFKGTMDKSRFLEIMKAKEVIVERKSEGPIHLDGEPSFMGKELNVKLFSKGLSVIVP